MNSDIQLLEMERVPLIRERVYQALLDAIVSRKLTPGQRIRERDVALQMGISTTPVKEALRRLENEHLVVKAGPRGVAVSPAALTSIREIVEIRANLEGLAARLAADKVGRGSHRELDTTVELMRASTSICDSEAASTHNTAFHRIIREASGNHFIQHFVDVLIAFDVSVRQAALRDNAELSRGLREHIAVYDAIRTGDGAMAERTMREHILRTVDFVLEGPSGTASAASEMGS